MHSVARLALAGYIDNIQASWCAVAQPHPHLLERKPALDRLETMRQTTSCEQGCNSRVKMGPERAVSLMKAGCNDMGKLCIPLHVTCRCRQGLQT